MSATPHGDDGFDQVLDKLRRVVEKLEQGNLSLEDSLKTFEEGVALARRGHALLDGAEKRVEMLVRGEGADRPSGDGSGG
jgi:exodeoxyribonuclease VII small subunit